MMAPVGASGKEKGGRPGAEAGESEGFTIAEMMVVFVLFAVVMASAVGLLMSQRSLYDVQYDRMDLQRNVRVAIDLVANELRTVPGGGIVSGSYDSITVRFPIRWGLACGYANKTVVKDGEPEIPAPDAEIYMPLETDPLFASEPQSGFGFRDTAGDWTFINDTGTPWEDSLYVESLVFCTEGPSAKVRKDKFDKETGELIERGDTAGPDYGRFFDFYTYVGFEAYQGAQIIAYTNVTYRFGPSTFDPGSRALFRVTANGEQELAGLFDDDSGFQFISRNGTVHSNLPPGHSVRLAAVRIAAHASKDNQSAGATRTLDYETTVDVPLRNFGDE